MTGKSKTGKNKLITIILVITGLILLPFLFIGVIPLYYASKRLAHEEKEKIKKDKKRKFAAALVNLFIVPGFGHLTMREDKEGTYLIILALIIFFVPLILIPTSPNKPTSNLDFILISIIMFGGLGVRIWSAINIYEGGNISKNHLVMIVGVLIAIISIGALITKYPALISILLLIILFGALFSLYKAYLSIKEKIEIRKRKKKLKAGLISLKKFIHDKNYNKGEEYSSAFRKAANSFDKGKFDRTEKFMEKARRLKKLRSSVKEKMGEIKNEIKLDEEELLRRTYKEIKKSFENGNYEKSKELVDIFWLSKEPKEKIEKIKDYYDEAESRKIKRLLDRAINNFNQNNFEKIKELHSKAYKKRQKERGLKKFGGKWLKPNRIKEIKSARIGLDNNFQDYSPYEFEEFIAELFEKMGYNTRVTRKSRDYGIDVVAKKDDETLGIQVKRNSESNRVGGKTVQNTLGSKYKIGADRTILVTTSYFTVPARKQAMQAPVELWNKNKLHKIVKEYFINEEDMDIEKVENILKISVDKETCIACGTCYSLDPDHFKADEKGKSEVQGGGIYGDSSMGKFINGNKDKVKEVENICPVDAITVEE